MPNLSNQELAAADNWTRIATIEGFFSRDQYVVWQWFFDYQRRRAIKGDITEIGVWKGRSAAALAITGGIRRTNIPMRFFNSDSKAD